MGKIQEPPYAVTDYMVNLVAEITALATILSMQKPMASNPRLRRDSQIQTIHASLAIENNSLSLEQVTEIFQGKRILGPPKDIKEVKNAFEVYEMLLDFDPYATEDLLKAHKILMQDLTREAGSYRRAGVGVFAGEQLVHMAPPANLVPELMKNLIQWIKHTDAHPLIKSCVFHYGFEFIHPFADGNGRMGRMWQTLILSQWQPLFAWIPIETLIKERQKEYYAILGECDKEGDSSKFIEFLLRIIADSLKEIDQTEQVTEQVTDYVSLSEPISRLLNAFSKEEMSATELMIAVGLKHRPTFRDNYLLPALEQGFIEMTIPDKPRSSKQKYRKIHTKRVQ